MDNRQIKDFSISKQSILCSIYSICFLPINCYLLHLAGASLRLIYFYPTLQKAKLIFEGLEGQNLDNYIFMHSRFCLLFLNPFLVDNHFHCRFASLFFLLTRKNLAVFVAFMMKRKKAHLFILWRKNLRREPVVQTETQRGSFIKCNPKATYVCDHSACSMKRTYGCC